MVSWGPRLVSSAWPLPRNHPVLTRQFGPLIMTVFGDERCLSETTTFIVFYIYMYIYVNMWFLYMIVQWQGGIDVLLEPFILYTVYIYIYLNTYRDFIHISTYFHFAISKNVGNLRRMSVWFYGCASKLLNPQNGPADTRWVSKTPVISRVK